MIAGLDEIVDETGRTGRNAEALSESLKETKVDGW